jgi:hypothetical protein
VVQIYRNPESDKAQQHRLSCHSFARGASLGERSDHRASSTSESGPCKRVVDAVRITRCAQIHDLTMPSTIDFRAHPQASRWHQQPPTSAASHNERRPPQLFETIMFSLTRPRRDKSSNKKWYVSLVKSLRFYRRKHGLGLRYKSCSIFATFEGKCSAVPLVPARFSFPQRFRPSDSKQTTLRRQQEIEP